MGLDRITVGMESCVSAIGARPVQIALALGGTTACARDHHKKYPGKKRSPRSLGLGKKSEQTSITPGWPEGHKKQKKKEDSQETMRRGARNRINRAHLRKAVVEGCSVLT